jgi:hypothetical protein
VRPSRSFKRLPTGSKIATNLPAVKLAKLACLT